MMGGISEWIHHGDWTITIIKWSRPKMGIRFDTESKASDLMSAPVIVELLVLAIVIAKEIENGQKCRRVKVSKILREINIGIDGQYFFQKTTKHFIQ